jgi:hypothetical protein
MPDYYQVPALVLTALLLPAFGYLYLRFRDTRTLLWFLGFLFAVVEWPCFTARKLGFSGWHPSLDDGSRPNLHSDQLGPFSRFPVAAALSHWPVQCPLRHPLHAIPLVVYSILFHGVLHGATPTGPDVFRVSRAGALSLIAHSSTGALRRAACLPGWGGLVRCRRRSGSGHLLQNGPRKPRSLSSSAATTSDRLAADLRLPAFVFGHDSGRVWLPALVGSRPAVVAGCFHSPALDLTLTRAIILAKVIAAMGMILLALEDQLAINQAAQERERRARRELEAYTNLILSRRRVEDFDRQAHRDLPDRHHPQPLCPGRAAAAIRGTLSACRVCRPRSGGCRRPVNWPGGFPSTASCSRLCSIRCREEPHSGPRSQSLAASRRRPQAPALYLSAGCAMAGRSVTEGALLLAGMRKSPALAVQDNFSNPHRGPPSRRRSAAHRNAHRSPASHAQPDHDA